MARAIGAVMAAVVFSTGAASAQAVQHGDTGTHEVGPYLLGLVSVQGEGDVRGVLQLRERAGHRTRVRGVVVGLPPAAGQRLAVGVTESPCDGADVGDFAPLGPAVEPGADGSALLEHEGILYQRSPVNSEAWLASVLVARQSVFGPLPVACAPAATVAADRPRPAAGGG